MALVVKVDAPENGTLPKAGEGVVLDALPYVESLDPNYEQYAISLIEEELQHTLSERNTSVDANGELEEHPALRKLLPLSFVANSASVSMVTETPDFRGRAPIATAAYESLIARQAAAHDGDIVPESPTEWTTRPDPMADNGGKINEVDDGKLIITDLETSIATSKIKLEQERLHLINLELHQQFENSRRWTDYHSQLEQHYTAPISESVARQRLKVDGINAGRMEEQEVAARKLQGLHGRFNQLVDKNHRLGKAISGLEAEVDDLRQTSCVGVTEG